MKKFLTFVLVLAMVLSVSGVAMAEGYVAKIDSTEYATFDEAITAANGMAGDVTVEIYGKVEYSDTTPNLTKNGGSISFEGKTADAEIYISRNGTNGYIDGRGTTKPCTINFTDLICSKNVGDHAYDAGHMNKFFSVHSAGDINYNNCTFPNGACCCGYTVKYTECVFNNPSDYSLWVYGFNTECIVTDCIFSGVRGAKMYSEADNDLSTLKITGSEFRNTITQKAAVVLTKGKSVELSGNTYNNSDEKGIVQIDSAYYTSLTSNNAEVTIEGTKYKVGEGEATSGAVLNIELPVAKINGVEYTSLKAAMDAAAGMTGDVTIELLDDVEWETGGEIGSTPFFATTDADANRTITIEGNGKTFTATGAGVGNIGLDKGKVVFKNLTIKDESVSYAEDAWEYGYLEFRGDLEFDNCTFVSAVMMSGTNAKFTGCEFNSNKDNEYAVWVDHGDATFTDCLFKGPRGLKVHEAYGSDVGNVVVDGCTFDGLTKKPGVVIGCIDRIHGASCDYCKDAVGNQTSTAITVEDSHFRSCQPGDQNKYAYETDTDVDKFNFTLGEDNHICEGKNKTTDWQTVKEPTATEDGLKVKLCLNNIIDIFNPSTTPGTTTSELCHYIVEEEIIPALGGGTTPTPTPTPKPTEKPASSGIKVTYNGGNSFSTSKSAVPTGVEIDGQPVPFNGDGKYFTVNSIPAGAKWVTVRWNSTSVTVNFTPSGAYFAEVEIPKTGDMPLWAAVAEFLGF